VKAKQYRDVTGSVVAGACDATDTPCRLETTELSTAVVHSLQPATEAPAWRAAKT